MDDSERWLALLRSTDPDRIVAIEALHDYLVRAAHSIAQRRKERLPADLRSDLDALCVDAASDALLAILRKLDTYRGESRFLTWAYRFVALELAGRLRRRAWRGEECMNDEVCSQVADDRPRPDQSATGRELGQVLQRGIEDLTQRQREILTAVAIERTPVDEVARKTGLEPGAIYKALHDARKRLRKWLIAEGLRPPEGRR